jgi:hypothetical protein
MEMHAIQSKQASKEFRLYRRLGSYPSVDFYKRLDRC